MRINDLRIMVNKLALATSQEAIENEIDELCKILNIMNPKTFTTRASRLYRELNDLGKEARDIITKFAQKHGGKYTFDIDDDDHIWVGDEIYATSLSIDSNGNVLVFNSANYSEYLNDMEDYNILDLATHILNL